LGIFRPIEKHCESVLQRFTQQKNNNGDSGTAVAAFSAEDWSVLQYIVPREKSTTMQCSLSSKFFDHLFYIHYLPH